MELDSDGECIGLDIDICWDTQDAELERISDLEQIQSLSLYSASITDAGLQYIANMPVLKKLRNVWVDADFSMMDWNRAETHETGSDNRAAVPQCHIEAARRCVESSNARSFLIAVEDGVFRRLHTPWYGCYRKRDAHKSSQQYMSKRFCGRPLCSIPHDYDALLPQNDI